MKLIIKKLSIFAFVGIFLFSVMMCCCFTNSAQAETQTPSCHQTTQDTESSQNTEECDCDQTLTIVKESPFLKDSMFQVSTISLNELSNKHIFVFVKANVYQAPLIVYDTSPLYIKHSTLCI